MELVKILWQFIAGLITNPWFVTLLILSILADILYPKFRGFMGEFWVKQELKKLPMDKYIVLVNSCILITSFLYNWYQ